MDAVVQLRTCVLLRIPKRLVSLCESPHGPPQPGRQTVEARGRRSDAVLAVLIPIDSIATTGATRDAAECGNRLGAGVAACAKVYKARGVAPVQLAQHGAPQLHSYLRHLPRISLHDLSRVISACFVS